MDKTYLHSSRHAVISSGSNVQQFLNHLYLLPTPKSNL
jgi:hypothetical protein